MPILIAAVGLLGTGRRIVPQRRDPPRARAASRWSHPGSHCPACEARCGPGTTSRCSAGWCCAAGAPTAGAPISAALPVVELVTAVLFVATTVEVARLGLLPALPAYLFFVAAGIALAAIDLDVMRLPNAIVYPSYAVVAVLLTVASAVTAASSRSCGPAIGAVALFAFFLALAIANPAAWASATSSWPASSAPCSASCPTPRVDRRRVRRVRPRRPGRRAAAARAARRAQDPACRSARR